MEHEGSLFDIPIVAGKERECQLLESRRVASSAIIGFLMVRLVSEGLVRMTEAIKRDGISAVQSFLRAARVGDDLFGKHNE